MKNYKMSAAVWRQYALRLARAIVRFQNDDFRLVHTDSTVLFAQRVIREGKKR